MGGVVSDPPVHSPIRESFLKGREVRRSGLRRVPSRLLSVLSLSSLSVVRTPRTSRGGETTNGPTGRVCVVVKGEKGDTRDGTQPSIEWCLTNSGPETSGCRPKFRIEEVYTRHTGSRSMR